ncbi:MAG: spore cortex biosynthesis protein YabQ [Clostridia bacterium]|nr:spore cortex biosynthesis protein YabQ [Clostridia bacterium]
MEISPVLYARLTVYAFLLGCIIGVICDVFRLFTSAVGKKIKRIGILRFFCDLFVCVAATVGLILLNYYFNKGVFRSFCLLGLGVGFFLYRHTLSYVVCPILSRIAGLIFAVLRVILAPISKICIKMVFFLIKTKYYMQKTLEKICKMVYNIYVQRKAIARARKGFAQKLRGNGTIHEK